MIVGDAPVGGAQAASGGSPRPGSAELFLRLGEFLLHLFEFRGVAFPVEGNRVQLVLHGAQAAPLRGVVEFAPAGGELGGELPFFGLQVGDPLLGPLDPALERREARLQPFADLRARAPQFAPRTARRRCRRRGGGNRPALMFFQFFSLPIRHSSCISQ